MQTMGESKQKKHSDRLGMVLSRAIKALRGKAAMRERMALENRFASKKGAKA